LSFGHGNFWAEATPGLCEENLRGAIMLLSAHFQGFCRDLYTESVQIIVSRVRASLQILIQDQFKSSSERSSV